jgi:cytochrome c biogenesis protein CcmG, thiol:disulfide interchange protein DsbE
MRPIQLLGRRGGFFALIFLAISVLAPPSWGQSSQFDISNYKGKVVYLDFWASWCGPCKQSFPYMAGLRQQYGKQGFVVVTVNLDKNRAQADAFLKKVGVSLPVTYDSAGAVAKQYRVTDMPTSIVFDRTGKARFTHKGFFQGKTKEYSAHVAQIINEH